MEDSSYKEEEGEDIFSYRTKKEEEEEEREMGKGKPLHSMVALSIVGEEEDTLSSLWKPLRTSLERGVGRAGNKANMRL